MSKQRKKRNSKIQATPDAPNYQKRCIKFSLRNVQDASVCGFADLPKDHKADLSAHFQGGGSSDVDTLSPSAWLGL